MNLQEQYENCRDPIDRQDLEEHIVERAQALWREGVTDWKHEPTHALWSGNYAELAGMVDELESFTAAQEDEAEAVRAGSDVGQGV